MSTTWTDLFVDAFDRVHGVVHRTVDGIGPAELTFRADAEANTIAWLVWHIARIQDDHIAALHRAEQTWNDGWFERFGLPFDREDHGYGHSSDDVAAVRVSGADLLGYFDAVHESTVGYVRTIRADDLDRIVDRSFDPPVTLGVRLVSVISDNLQHAGQAAVIRGLATRSLHS
jgi:hypothetical protein